MSIGRSFGNRFLVQAFERTQKGRMVESKRFPVADADRALRMAGRFDGAIVVGIDDFRREKRVLHVTGEIPQEAISAIES